MVDPRSAYERVVAVLDTYPDRRLRQLVDTGEIGERRFGRVDVAGVPILVKVVPLTDRELAHPRSTANLYGLPLFCQYSFGLPDFPSYGFGGPAINAWREVAANEILTDALLARRTSSFPMMYHWRVLPGAPTTTAGTAEIDAVVTALGGSERIRQRLTAVVEAQHRLVLCLEYLPHAVEPWLVEDPANKAPMLETGLLVQAFPIWGDDLAHPERFANPTLIRAIASKGIGVA